jgi:hypothetical protein
MGQHNHIRVIQGHEIIPAAPDQGERLELHDVPV